MATGKLDSMAYPTFAALVAACQGPACPLSFLTFGNYSATGNLVAMSRVPYLQSLQKLANADAVEGNARSPYHDRFALDRIERALQGEVESRAAQPRLPRAEHAENMLYAAQVNSKALERVTPYIPREIPKERLSQQADIALASFKAGVCVSANLSIGQFDSHANNDADQMKLIPEFLAGIRYLIRRAEDLKIRDRLVVVVQSEMGRTPNYNSGNGKDHWSIGSIMFLGRGIKGNRVIGATDEKQFHVPVNPQTLACDRPAASGSAPSTSTRPCGSSPASPTIRSARNSRSESPTRSGCEDSGVKNLSPKGVGEHGRNGRGTAESLCHGRFGRVFCPSGTVSNAAFPVGLHEGTARSVPVSPG